MTERFVKKTSNPDEYWIRERCYIREIVNTPEINAWSLAETRVEPGVTTELHHLDVHETYVISEGSGLMEVNDEPPATVGPGDIIDIPAGMSQRITNNGKTDLRFLCVCRPRFTPDCYHGLESN